jgi:hypothetical protein
VFEMAALIQSPTKCEVHSIIWFLNAKRACPVETHKQIVAVCGDVMNQQNVTSGSVNSPKGGLMFMMNKGAVDHLCDDLLQNPEGEIRAYRRGTIRELHHIIP